MRSLCKTLLSVAIIFLAVVAAKGYYAMSKPESRYPIHQKFALDDLKQTKERIAQLLSDAVLLRKEYSAEQYLKMVSQLDEMQRTVEQLRIKDGQSP